MFEQFLDIYRSKATEATVQLQQEMLRYWTQQWPKVLGAPAPASAAPAAWAAQVQDAQRKWTEAVTDLLTKHRETLDAQYRAGIRTIEDAFRVGEARDPEQFRTLVEALWRQSVESLKTVVEAQTRDFQAAAQRWFEVASQGAAAATKAVNPT